MPAPVIEKESQKPESKSERVTETRSAKQANVRPEVAKLIKKVIRENAPTWKELAKR